MSGKKLPAHVMKEAEAKRSVEAIRKHLVTTKEMAPHRDTSQYRKQVATKSSDEKVKASQARTQATKQRQAKAQERNIQMMEHEKAQQQQQGRGR